jgi:hypothetical protein
MGKLIVLTSIHRNLVIGRITEDFSSQFCRVCYCSIWRISHSDCMHYICSVSCTVKGVRGKVSFDSQNDKHASQLSCDASPEAYLSLRVTVKRICHLVNEMWQIRLRRSFTGQLCNVQYSYYVVNRQSFCSGQYKNLVIPFLMYISLHTFSRQRTVKNIHG